MSLNNSQYNAIMRIYNQRQFQDKYEQDQRREEVYQKVPQIKQIEDEISSQAVRCARRLLDGDTNAKEELGAVVRLWISGGLYGDALHLPGMSGHGLH